MKCIGLFLLLAGCYSPQLHVGDRIQVAKGLYAGCEGTVSAFRIGDCIFSGGTYTLIHVDCFRANSVFHEYNTEVCANDLQ